MSLSATSDEENDQLHIDLVIACPRASSLGTKNGVSTRYDWLLSVLNGRLPSDTTRTVLEYESEDIIQGQGSRDAVRQKANDILNRLLEHRKSLLGSSSPIIWVGHEIGATIIKDAITIAALDSGTYESIYASSSLCIFLDSFDCTRMRIETINRVAKWATMQIETQFPALLPSIQVLGAAVKDINETFLETKLPQFVRVASLYSSENLHRTTWDGCSSRLGAFEQRDIILGGDESQEKAKDDIERMIEAATRSLSPAIQNPWVQPLYAISPPRELLLHLPSEKNPKLQWVPRADVCKQWCESSGPLALQIYGPNASDALCYFCENDSELIGDDERLLVHFTFDSYDIRRKSGLAMATSIIAQIISASESPASTIHLFRQRLSFHAWALYDALYILEWLTYGMNLVIVLKNLDQCDPESRQLMFDFFGKLVSLTENKIKILVSTKTSLKEWPGQVLNTEPDENLRLCQDEFQVSDSLDAHVAAGKTDPNAFYEEIVAKHFKLLVDGGKVPEGIAEDLIRHISVNKEADLREALLFQLAESHMTPPTDTLLCLTKFGSPESLFRQLLTDIPEASIQLARQILCWILFSVRPLSPQELSGAALWIQHHEVSDNSDLSRERQNDLLSEIIGLLWGILLIRNNEVGFTHTAIRDLLLGEGVEWFRIAQDGHRYLASSCLDMLSQLEILTWMEKRRGAATTLGTETLLVFPSMFEDRTSLHEYVIRYWSEHYLRCPISKRPRREVIDFFREDSKQIWQCWAESRWTMSNPMNRVHQMETISQSSLVCLAGIGDVDLFRDWEAIAGTLSSADRGNALVEASQAGAKEAVKYFLEGEPLPETYLQASLTAAASSGQSETILVLIEAVPEDFDWPAPLLVRVCELGYEHCANALLSRGVSPNNPVSFSDTTPLLRAARNGHNNLCSLLLNYGAQPEAAGGLGLLMSMAAGGSANGEDVIRTLVKFGNDSTPKDSKDRAEHSALDESSRLGHFQITKVLSDILIESGNTPDVVQVEQWFERAMNNNFIRTAAPLLSIIKAHSASSSIMHKQLGNAARGGRVQFARLLLDNGADVVSPSGPGIVSVLLEACDSPEADLEMVETLINGGVPVSTENGASKSLIAAARRKNLGILSYLVDRGADVNGNEATELSALSEAAGVGALDCVRFLIDNGADIDKRDLHGESAIFEAGAARHFEVVKYLCDRGATLSGQGWNGRTLPILCVSSPDTLQVVLRQRSEINTMDNSGRAPLHWATRFGHVDSVHTLLECQADVEIKGSGDFFQLTPLMTAVTAGDEQAILALLEAGAAMDSATVKHGFSALHYSSASETTAALLQYGPNVDITDVHGRTPLIHRTSDEHPDLVVIKRLVNAGADVNALCNEGCCFPLWFLASSTNGRPLMEYLIGKGADIHMSTPQRGSIMHQACFRGDVELVKYLHAAGVEADVCVGTYPGTPLQAACMSYANDDKVMEILRYLLEEVAVDVNQYCGTFGTALCVACRRETTQAFNLLLEHNAATDVPDSMGRTPLHHAAVTGRERFQTLADIGCDYDAADNSGRTLLQWAVQSGDVEVVKMILISSDADVDQRDGDGWTALCWAARGMTANIARIDNESRGTTEEVINLLLGRGADKFLEVRGDDNQYWTPLQIAIFHDSGTGVHDLLRLDDNEATKQNLMEKRPHFDKESSSVKQGHRHGVVGTAYCNTCLSYIAGTRHTCKNCYDFDFCFKCYFQREKLHDPSHEFESRGPIFKAEAAIEDDRSDRSGFSEDRGSQISIESIDV